MIEPALVFVTLLPPMRYSDPRRLARLGRLLKNETGIQIPAYKKGIPNTCLWQDEKLMPMRLTQFSN